MTRATADFEEGLDFAPLNDCSTLPPPSVVSDAVDAEDDDVTICGSISSNCYGLGSDVGRLSDVESFFGDDVDDQASNDLSDEDVDATFANKDMPSASYFANPRYASSVVSGDGLRLPSVPSRSPSPPTPPRPRNWRVVQPPRRYLGGSWEVSFLNFRFKGDGDDGDGSG